VKRSSVVAVAVVAALALGACGSSKKSGTTTTTKKGKPAGVVVYTIPQLKSVLTALVHAYNKANPKLPFRLPITTDTQRGVAGSVAQARAGVAVLPVTSLKKLAAGETKGTFGRNLAVIAVPAANPHHVSDLKSFASTSGLRTAACGPKTAFGNAPYALLIRAHITPSKGAVLFDCEAKVLQDLAKGTLDAALLYRAGLTVPPGVKLLAVPTAQNVILEYSYVLVGPAPKVAAFGKFLASSAAQAILTKKGYLP
jgi:ABC-type molybdate transport system substrate-binding protein